MTGETTPLSIPEKRAFIAEYVETMAPVITRESHLSNLIQAAIAADILNITANIPDESIEEWYTILHHATVEVPKVDDQEGS